MISEILPIRQLLYKRYPNTYEDNLCSKCLTEAETQKHVLNTTKAYQPIEKSKPNLRKTKSQKKVGTGQSHEWNNRNRFLPFSKKPSQIANKALALLYTLIWNHYTTELIRGVIFDRTNYKKNESTNGPK
ncbi:1950_t:CDS:2 [Acaulospora morrowiae]|uniref:1950_t:CDS:1 n=1 Tax=Acaulospora morrowiae TaxID=94023 RepID=A0A9N9HI97_9GLOM|nr:1950_t:CDS:2 [Acaulospora morrowiae]